MWYTHRPLCHPYNLESVRSKAPDEKTKQKGITVNGNISGGEMRETYVVKFGSELVLSRQD